MPKNKTPDSWPPNSPSKLDRSEFEKIFPDSERSLGILGSAVLLGTIATDEGSGSDSSTLKRFLKQNFSWAVVNPKFYSFSDKSSKIYKTLGERGFVALSKQKGKWVLQPTDAGIEEVKQWIKPDASYLVDPRPAVREAAQLHYDSRDTAEPTQPLSFGDLEQLKQFVSDKELLSKIDASIVTKTVNKD